MAAAGFVLVYYELVLRKKDSLRRVLRPNLEGVVDGVPEEPLLMPRANVPDNDVPFVIAPHNFRDREALADCVQEVEHDILKPLDPADLRFYELGDLLVSRVVRVERDDLVVEARDCVLSRLELGKEVRVFLLHLLKKLGLPEHISRVGLLEDLRQTDGGEPVRGVLAVLVRHLGDRDLSRLRPRCLRRPQEPPPREPLIFALVGQTVPPPFSRPRVGT